MNKADWERVKVLFDEAQHLAPDERATFLADNCGDDSELREQVQKLLGFYDSEFLESPALNNADAILVDDKFAPGQVIGRYVIRELIGTGGMGQVFRADDTELDRPVAFKVLHHDIAEDKERVRRFIQEARAASALNHPNILTIYEIGSFDGARFIVSEYIDGETLRDRMRRGISLDESVDVACQVAAALKAAHTAGIVHRDIKPENVMIRHDGLVKVLDFGLAKLTEADDKPIDTSAALSRFQTSPGAVMGTVAYMSPEQARGQAVDARTDLWSLGVVLHEMLTGESPFTGESVADLVTSILKLDPASLDLTSISQELKPICTKALTKDREHRYQTAQDLLHDLQGEKKRMEYAIQPTPYVTVSTSDEMKTQLIRRRPTLSAEYIVTSVKRHKYATITAIAMIITGAVSLSVYKYNGATPPDLGQNLATIDDTTTEGDLKFAKLPISGQTWDIAISPDGKYVSYLSGKSIRLLEIGTSLETEIASEGGWNLSFSPDSQSVYYSYGTDPNSTAGIMRLSIKGGAPIKVVDDPLEGVRFSPDGLTMVFTRELSDGTAIVLANPDGSNQRTLAKTPPVVNIPVFSPDGKTIACHMQFKDESGIFLKIIGISVADGTQQVLSGKKWNGAWAAVWLPNGNLVVTAREGYSDPSQIWSVSPGEEPKALTNGPVNYRRLSATRNGDILVTTQVIEGDARDLWMVSGNGTTKDRRITTSGEVRGRFALTPDGRIVMTSDVGGNPDIWVMNANGGGRKQLTHEPGIDSQPTVSTDGKYIAFTSNRAGGVNHIFRMDIDGGNVKQLTQGAQQGLASFSPDGKWVYFVEFPSKTIQRVLAGGGESAVVATAPDGWELLGIDVNKADGRLVYGLQKRVSNAWQYKLGILPVKGEAKLIDVPATLEAGRPRWAPDNRTIALMSISTRDIWSVRLDGKGKPRQLTDFRSPGTADPRWTADGKQLIVNRGTSISNPVLIRNSGN